MILELVDPWKYSLPQAIELGRRLLALEPTLDIKLVRAVPHLQGEWAERALQILDEISEGHRVVPFMSHLVAHKDPRISSKCVLIVGKRMQQLDWARRQLTEAIDSRVRANAIEALWGISTEPVLKMFRERLTDRHHRVVGNAIIGLHMALEAEANQAVLKVADNSNPAFRTMASWVMGKIGDESYTQRLSQLLRDGDPAVRSAALRSLREIRQHRANRNG
jgi:HEAT repeat protein